MSVNFQGIERQIEMGPTSEKLGIRSMLLIGPKATFSAIERAVQPGSFLVLNSRGRVIGNLLEVDGQFIED